MAETSAVKRSWHWFVNAIAFVAVVILAVVLLIARIGGNGSFFNTLREVGNALAYVVALACSFVYVSGKMRRKKGWIYLLIWAIAAVTITITYILLLVYQPS